MSGVQSIRQVFAGLYSPAGKGDNQSSKNQQDPKNQQGSSGSKPGAIETTGGVANVPKDPIETTGGVGNTSKAPVGMASLFNNSALMTGIGAFSGLGGGGGGCGGGCGGNLSAKC